ncbi:putative ATP-dependent endonuclease [Arcobacter venerupis]|uniref:ATP-dependent endonuclease n=1 Tax=Arcobacter venerupis TaxID=1054033 RepID=A0AAE7BCF3_9BACT|nr:AAA family ATPase [Arcobacter venerupis]QKF67847.1 putative ATP-dependent endonuclease [Arcobacter venerupis]RWS49454.1 hypothetical protein CKA56_08710 [Arcobacter venerupis]
MILEKVLIENFKSINSLEIDVKKIADSYTTYFIGLNEVGKTNILKALSYFNCPANKDNDYFFLSNQKNEDKEFIDLYYFLKFENKDIYLKKINEKIIGKYKLEFEIIDIEKNVFMKNDSIEFEYMYNYKLKVLNKNLYLKKLEPQVFELFDYHTVDSELVTEEEILKHFNDLIFEIIEQNEPLVSFWRPSDEYLISEVNLKDFQKNPDSNIPLKNIFTLAGYKTYEEINITINSLGNRQIVSRLKSKLSTKTTEYVKKIWNHNIIFEMDISDSKICSISIKDDGEENKHNFYNMSTRSDGFKQFISLILSLSIETKENDKINRLILIDEPEIHLHPSGIRDLGKELLEIGKYNFLFVSTHSPFIIDQINKERHIIIKKDKFANTIKKRINSYDDLRDDEVLFEAFGINIFKDLLVSKRLLVEGASDRLILYKLFEMEKIECGITNSRGSNITLVASKFNQEEIDIMVLVDGDKDGNKYKENILELRGIFNSGNVYTLNDLVPKAISDCTIEDFLGKNFIQGKFNEFYKKSYGDDISLEIDESKPIVEQIKIYLIKNREELKEDKKQLKFIIDNFKIFVSEEIKFQKSSWKSNFPLFDELIKNLKLKLI